MSPGTASGRNSAGMDTLFTSSASLQDRGAQNQAAHPRRRTERKDDGTRGNDQIDVRHLQAAAAPHWTPSDEHTFHADVLPLPHLHSPHPRRWRESITDTNTNMVTSTAIMYDREDPVHDPDHEYERAACAWARSQRAGLGGASWRRAHPGQERRPHRAQPRNCRLAGGAARSLAG